MKSTTLTSIILFFSIAVFSQNFGIDQPSPAEKLDVNGNIKATGVIYWGNSGTRTETLNDAGLQGTRSGFFETSGPSPATNWYPGASSWQHLLSIRHNNPANNYALQFAGSFFDQDLWYRKTNNNAAQAWTKIGGAPAIWSGGCNYHGSAGGWNTYCNNSTDFNSSAGYISADGGGTFTVQTAGYYRISFWTISLASNYCHALFYHNGTYRHYGYEYVHGAWSDNFIDITWPMNVGDTFYISVYNGGSYAFHSWNPNGAHSRLQVIYKGPL